MRIKITLFAVAFLLCSITYGQDENSNRVRIPITPAPSSPVPETAFDDWVNLILLTFIVVFLLFLAVAIGVLFKKIAVLKELVIKVDNRNRALENKINRPLNIVEKTAIKDTKLPSSSESANISEKISAKNIVTPRLSEIDKLKAEIDELKKEIDLKVALKARISELKREVDLLKNKLREDEIPSEVIEPRLEALSNIVPRYEPSYKSKISQEVFYLSSPNEDGSFNEKSAHSSYREGASIYKFTKSSQTQAEFQIDERETSVKLALAYPSRNIVPVCEAQNAYNAKAVQIITVQGGIGKAVLDGDRWRITKKAVIKYEY